MRSFYTHCGIADEDFGLYKRGVVMSEGRS